MRKHRTLLALGAAVCAVFGGARMVHAGAFVSSKDIVVVRVGDGTNNYSGDFAPVYLDEYNVSGASPVLVNTVALPATGSANCTEPYATGGRDGYLLQSTDGHYLTFLGNNVDAGSPSTTAITASVVAVIGANGTVDTSTRVTNYANGPRSAVSTDGTNIWMTDNGTGSNALAYTTKGSTSATIIPVTGSNGFRVVNVVKNNGQNQMYIGGGSTPKGIYSLTPGAGDTTPLPTNGTAATQTLLTGDSSSEPFLLDTNGDGLVDTMYVSGSSSFTKYSLVSGSWVSNGSITPANGDYVTGVTAMMDSTIAGDVDVFYSTDKGVYKYLDTGYNTTLSGSASTIYIAPGANEAFRGVAFTPTSVPEPASLGLIGLSAAGLLARRRRK